MSESKGRTESSEGWVRDYDEWGEDEFFEVCSPNEGEKVNQLEDLWDLPQLILLNVVFSGAIVAARDEASTSERLKDNG